MREILVGEKFNIEELDHCGGSYIKIKVYKIYNDDIELILYESTLGHKLFAKIEGVNTERYDIANLYRNALNAILYNKKEFKVVETYV